MEDLFMGNLASENSVWLKEYVKRVSGAKAKSDKSKGPIILIVIPLLLAAGIGFAIYNGGLNDPQTLNTIKILSCIAGGILVLGIILIAVGKKKNVTTRTETNLNELLRSVDEVKAFDAQMASEPVFVVGNDKNNYFAATKDYLYKRFPDLGNETYTFVRLKDIASLHFQLTRGATDKDYLLDFRDEGGQVLLSGYVSGRDKLDQLAQGMSYVLAGVKMVEDEAES